MISIYYPPYSFGGDGIYLGRLCRELTRQGHEVDVIHCADSFHLFKEQVEPGAEAVAEGVHVHRLESRWRGWAPTLAHQIGRPLLQGRAIAEILGSKPFDVIHYHNISLFGPGVLELPVPGDAVRLYTAHDHWLVCPLSVLWKNGKQVCDRPTCLTCTLRSGRPPQLWRYGRLLERAIRRVDKFISPTKFCSDMHRERGFQPPMEVLNYFLPAPEEPSREESARPQERPYFLFIGRLEKYKGVQDLIEAFRGPGDYDLLIGGAGSYEEELRRAADGVERARFIGWVNQQDVGRLYAHAVATLTPSVTYETFGIVVIESYARGTPVIARALGPLPELIEEAQGGMLFESVAELRQAMEHLYGDRELRDRLGRQARQAFERRWTPQPHLDRYFEIIAAARRERRSG
jgi:glycosyltransferase involved in cell wall biosynthesis